jgi:carboxypeptidase family protein/TonB-dependent receptor-like protein
MFASPTQWLNVSIRLFLLCVATLTCAAAVMAQAQSNAADLQGAVRDPSGAAVAGATVTARNLATNITRTTTTNADGIYQILGLPPGNYEVTAEATGFSKGRVASATLTVGQRGDLDIPMAVGDVGAVVDISSAEVSQIETSSNTVSNTIDQRRIENLPINERSATGFALTLSTVGRDNGRPIGPAPTSGLNIGGQRGRSTQVSVDGADFTDNSINAARTTVSQEAVQEYQVATNSYAPEFGRATGGIVNVVTKSGTNDFHGNAFGFIRHKSIQARNALAPLIDNDPSKKPPFTRAQYGFTIGGPIKKDKAFFFYSFEQRRRQESGFFTGDIVGGATSSVTIGPPFLPVSQTFTNLTPAQASFIQASLASLNATRIGYAVAYATLASAGGQTALNGTSPLVNFIPLPTPGVPQGQVIGGRFILSSQPIPLTRNAAGELVAFRPLAGLRRVFPISEGSTYNSFRFDHSLSRDNQLSLRFGYNPSRISGIQDESQNQTLGQNDFSRTGIQKLRDTSFGAALSSVLPHNMVNELYFNFGRRKASFDSQVPSVAHQIAGTGFIGSNPFSPVDRTEQRYQIRDNLSWVMGNHTMKFGGDFNWIDVKARFELNFPALFNFGQQAGGSLVTIGGVPCDSPSIAAADRCPPITPIQAYGLGFPSVFLQGFGNPNSGVKNRPIAFFAQDTWKIHKNFTLNYGLRYDIELTDTFEPVGFKDPLTGITLSAQDIQTAQDALNVQQGFPRDKNNWAPRLGFAWDVTGDSKTVVRGAVGLFYDHPLLAVAFNSDIGDGSQQQQSTLLPIGGPSPTGLFNAFQVFHGTAIPGVTPGLAASARYLNGFQRFDPSTFTGFGPILPFTLHVGKDFEYPYATQGNLTFERQVGRNTVLSASFITVNARHLAHPQDVNIVQSSLLVDNFRRFTANNPVACGGPCPATGRAPTGLAEAAFFSLPTTPSALYTIVIPGLIVVNNTTGLRIVSPIAADFFRRLGPNYFFVAAITGGAVNKATFDSLIAGSLRAPGPINPYADVNAQLSDGNSFYNAMNLELKKRFSNNFQFLASYTWSHSIDDSSDLQTLLKPQDNTNFRAERSDSLFDQRHRFVFSGVFSAPEEWKGAGGMKAFLRGFSFSPIVEVSSGRPFNILAVGDANGDFQSSNERPTVLSDGRLCATGVDAGCFQGIFPANGSLGRNRGITHGYFSVDARLTRQIRLGERIRLDVIAEGFNLFNRFNEASANPFYQVVNAFGQRDGGKYFSQPTATFDPRQFQFGLKLNF